MKKSKSIRLALLGSTGFALVACDEAPPTDARFYASVDECSAIHGKASCEQAFAQSEATHAAEAPQFNRKEECEAEFGAGNCETKTASTSGGGMGSFFMPMMMGYMVGRMLSPGMPGAAGRMGSPTTARPVYSDRGGFLHAGGAQVGRLAPGATGIGPSGMATRVTTRGGFGSSARSFGGGS